RRLWLVDPNQSIRLLIDFASAQNTNQHDTILFLFHQALDTVSNGNLNNVKLLMPLVKCAPSLVQYKSIQRIMLFSPQWPKETQVEILPLSSEILRVLEQSRAHYSPEEIRQGEMKC